MPLLLYFTHIVCFIVYVYVQHIHSVKHLIPLAYYEGAGESYAALSMVFGPVMSDIAQYQQQFNCTLNRTPSPPISTAASSTATSNSVPRHIQHGLKSFGGHLHIDDSNTCVSPSCNMCKQTGISAAPPPYPLPCSSLPAPPLFNHLSIIDLRRMVRILIMPKNIITSLPHQLLRQKSMVIWLQHLFTVS